MHSLRIRARLGDDFAVLRRRRIVQVQRSEAAKDRNPQDEQNEVPEPERSALDDGRDVDHDRNCGHACDRDGVHPRSVGGSVRLVGGGQISTIEARDRDREHELQEADEDAGPSDGLATRAVVLIGSGVHAEVGGYISFWAVNLLLASGVLADLFLAIGSCSSGAEGVLLRRKIGEERVGFCERLWRRW